MKTVEIIKRTPNCKDRLSVRGKSNDERTIIDMVSVEEDERDYVVMSIIPADVRKLRIALELRERELVERGYLAAEERVEK